MDQQGPRPPVPVYNITGLGRDRKVAHRYMVDVACDVLGVPRPEGEVLDPETPRVVGRLALAVERSEAVTELLESGVDQSEPELARQWDVSLCRVLYEVAVAYVLARGRGDLGPLKRRRQHRAAVLSAIDRVARADPDNELAADLRRQVAPPRLLGKDGKPLKEGRPRDPAGRIRTTVNGCLEALPPGQRAAIATALAHDFLGAPDDERTLGQAKGAMRAQKNRAARKLKAKAERPNTE